MRIAVVDVGSNTIRLLVGRRKRGRIEVVSSAKLRVGLGEDVELLGRITERRLAAAAKAVRRLSTQAREHGAERIEVLITSPGRQASNAGELVTALTRAARGPVRVLTAAEEGLLAYAGAITTGPHEGLVAVCDLGGASTEIAIGIAPDRPVWIHSVYIGALRLATRFELGERPRADAIEAARDEVTRLFAGIAPPLPRTALAVGGTARALRTLAGSPSLAPDELECAVALLSVKSHRMLTRRHGISAARLRVLLAGALILTEVQRRLVVPLVVANAGLREGALMLQRAELAA